MSYILWIVQRLAMIQVFLLAGHAQLITDVTQVVPTECVAHQPTLFGDISPLIAGEKLLL